MYDNLSFSEIIKSYQTDVTETLSVNYILYKISTENGESYSLRATVRGSDETALVQDITGNPRTAEYIFDMISRGKVTPCCIFEVIEDLIEAMPPELPL